jgi:large conductance mechanosensitive channel
MKLKLVDEFKAFALKGNVVDLAVAVIIGAAFGKIITALVGDIIMPIIGGLLPGKGEWREITVTPLQIKIGDFTGAVVDFVIIAAVLFLVMVKLLGALHLSAPPPPATKVCPECLVTIPLAAKRCKACTSVQSA